MFELITIDVSSSKPEGMGRKSYKTIPRIGEWVEIEIDEIGNMFEVVMVVHSPAGHDSDIYVKHLTKTPQAISGLCNRTSV